MIGGILSSSRETEFVPFMVFLLSLVFFLVVKIFVAGSNFPLFFKGYGIFGRLLARYLAGY